MEVDQKYGTFFVDICIIIYMPWIDRNNSKRCFMYDYKESEGIWMDQFFLDDKNYLLDGTLNQQNKKLYEIITEGVYNSKERISLIGLEHKYTCRMVRKIMDFVYRDHPEFFWRGSSSLSYEQRDGRVTEIHMKYKYKGEQLKKMKRELMDAVLHFTHDVKGTDEEKEKMIHDRMARELQYQENEFAYNAYGALVKKRAVCAGYSKGFQLLLRFIGIPSMYIGGKGYTQKSGSWGGHAWNIVKVNGEFKNVDLTWDENLTINKKNKIVDRYFNKSDEEMKKNHKRDYFEGLLWKCN